MSEKVWKRGLVRGEAVKIVSENVAVEDRNRSVLGAMVRDATTLVEYPDREYGFVRPSEVKPL